MLNSGRRSELRWIEIVEKTVLYQSVSEVCHYWGSSIGSGLWRQGSNQKDNYSLKWNRSLEHSSVTLERQLWQRGNLDWAPNMVWNPSEGDDPATISISFLQCGTLDVRGVHHLRKHHSRNQFDRHIPDCLLVANPQHQNSLNGILLGQS